MKQDSQHHLLKSPSPVRGGLGRGHLKNKISFIVFLVLCFTLVYSRFLLPRWETHDVLSILTWDVFGYYLYLPAYFIHHDPGLNNFAWVRELLATHHPTIGFYQAYLGPTGDYVMKYPVGMAILYLPFFFIGHIFAVILGYSPDGFTLPYQVSIAMGGLVYSLIGILVLRKVLLKFFSDFISAIILVLIVLGTNYFELTAYDGAMPHNYLFTLYSLVLWLTIRWHENPKWKFIIFLGLTIGITILVRFTDAICFLIPLLWGIHNKESFKTKWNLLCEKYKQLIICIACVALVLFIQMLYWKIHTGSFFYYSYEPGEKLKFLAPYFMHVLFSFKKGWLIYTPMAIFMISGFYFTWKMNRSIFFAMFLFFIINLMIIASWPTWWYGGSLGQRTFMESYAFLALPFGYFLQWLGQRKFYIKTILYSVFLLFIVLNLFQTWQYMNFIIDPSRMTRSYYWRIFGKTHVNPKDRKHLEAVENPGKGELKFENEYFKKILGYYDFEQNDQNFSRYQTAEFARTGKYSLKLTPEFHFSPGIEIKFKDLTNRESVWIRATGYVYFKSSAREALASLVTTCNHNGSAINYQTVDIEKENFLPNQWHKVTVDYETPVVSDRKDLLQVYFWYRGKDTLYLDDFIIEIFEPKE